MIGLEYILDIFNMQHIELAEKLGIKKQNINMWIKGKQNIPKKYLPVFENIFNIPGGYFSKELNEIEIWNMWLDPYGLASIKSAHISELNVHDLEFLDSSTDTPICLIVKK